MIVAVGTVAGEPLVLFISGVFELAGIFLALLAVVADRAGWSYAWELGFSALALASLAGAGGLWKVSGEVGPLFLSSALTISGLLWLGLHLFRRRFKKPGHRQCHCQRACRDGDGTEQHQWN
jgi:hypothetical protein